MSKPIWGTVVQYDKRGEAKAPPGWRRVGPRQFYTTPFAFIAFRRPAKAKDRWTRYLGGGHGFSRTSDFILVIPKAANHK